MLGGQGGPQKEARGYGLTERTTGGIGTGMLGVTGSGGRRKVGSGMNGICIVSKQSPEVMAVKSSVVVGIRIAAGSRHGTGMTTS